MPIYEYECRECGHRFEQMQRFSDPPVGTCPECGGGVRRVLHPAGIIFKGSGWYITDHRPSETAAAGAGKRGDGDAQGDSKDEAKSTTKTEAKSAAKSKQQTAAASSAKSS